LNSRKLSTSYELSWCPCLLLLQIPRILLSHG